jgi:hypothetical protein
LRDIEVDAGEATQTIVSAAFEQHTAEIKKQQGWSFHWQQWVRATSL